MTAESLRKQIAFLDTKVRDLDISVRTYNTLRRIGIETVNELVQMKVGDLLKFRDFGKKSLIELENLLSENDLSFGTNPEAIKSVYEVFMSGLYSN